MTGHDALETAETAYVKKRISDFSRGRGAKGQFDVAHLKAIHKHLFQDVYEWAGRTRDERVVLSDQSVATEPFLKKIDGKPFLQGPLIADRLKHITDKLRSENRLRGFGREEFANRAAALMADLNGVHPFREGNGRTQRVFVSELAREAGHKLDFTTVSRERMIQASIAGNDGDPAMMQLLFREISDPSRVAALRIAIKSLEEHGFDWNSRYIATAEPGHTTSVRLVGIAGDQFMARTKDAILIGQSRDLPNPPPGRDQEFTFLSSSWSSQ